MSSSNMKFALVTCMKSTTSELSKPPCMDAEMFNMAVHQFIKQDRYEELYQVYDAYHVGTGEPMKTILFFDYEKLVPKEAASSLSEDAQKAVRCDVLDMLQGQGPEPDIIMATRHRVDTKTDLFKISVRVYVINYFVSDHRHIEALVDGRTVMGTPYDLAVYKAKRTLGCVGFAKDGCKHKLMPVDVNDLKRVERTLITNVHDDAHEIVVPQPERKVAPKKHWPKGTQEEQDDAEKILLLVPMLSEKRATDREDWLRVGFALHRYSCAYGEEDERFFLAFDEFSMRSSKYDSRGVFSMWKSARNDQENGVGIGTIVDWVKADNIDNPDRYAAILKTKKKKTAALDEEGLVPVGIQIDDEYAAAKLCEIMGKRIVSVAEVLYMFDDNTGMWSSSQDVHRGVVMNMYKNDLIFKQDKGDGKVKIYNYGGKLTNIDLMLKAARTKCVDEEFFIRNVDSAIGKLLFKDGIYDFDTDTFYKDFDYGVVFLARIDRPFPKTRDESVIKEVKKILFEDTFSPDTMCVSDFLRIGFARGLYGDYVAKLFYILVGMGNAGKGVLVAAFKAAFGGFVGSFDLNNMAVKSAMGEASYLNKWMLNIVDKRLVFSNELKMHITLDVEILKEIVSGGDSISIRDVREKEVQKVNQSTLVCMCNDVGRFSSFNDDMRNRTVIGEMNNVFKKSQDEIVRDNHRLADPTIKRRFKEDQNLQDALVWLMISSYKEYKRGGHVMPKLMKDAVDKWVGNESSLRAILEKRFDITMDEADSVPSDVIVEHLQKNGVTMSKEKIGREREELGFKRKQVTQISGGRPWCWIGLKEKTIEVMSLEDLRV